MANPSQRINVTELDFDQIKANLIAYFQASDSPFKDWNYAGGGLNTIIDLLSHNTHYNAVLAHMAVNESFIDSAQLRPNVVSAAKLIGYTPNSYTAPTATVNISRSFSSAALDSGDTTVIIAGTIFTTRINKVSYEFVNLDDIILTLNNGVYSGTGTIHQGSLITTSSQINNLQGNNQYIIEHKNIDISTLQVSVYPTNTALYEIYNKFEQIANINGTSPIYFIAENYNGNYFISFGNGTTFGKIPDNLGRLQLKYLVTDGPIANGAGSGALSKFTITNDPNLPYYTVNTATDANGNTLYASGGSYNESISSIKFNAPLNFIAQNRAVTADDYKAIIKRDFPNAQTVAVWGGEENDPPYYGQVFISIAKAIDSTGILHQLDDTDRSQILNILSGKKVLSILPQVVDYDYLNIVLDVMFKYNKNQTTLSTIQMESAVRQTVSNFNAQYLQSFDGVFRQSLLSKTIDNSNPSILNSLVRVYISKTFSIKAGSPTVLTLKYGVPLNPENDVVIINSSGWTYKGTTLYLGDVVHPNDSNKRIIYSYSITPSGAQLVYNFNVGSIDLTTGIVELAYLNADANTDIALDLIPASNDIASARNKLIQIDTARISVYGEVDAIVSGGTNQAVNYNTFKRDR